MTSPDPAAVQRQADELTAIINHALRNGYTPPRPGAVCEDSPEQPAP
jgi:hypothetical protein